MRARLVGRRLQTVALRADIRCCRSGIVFSSNASADDERQDSNEQSGENKLRGDALSGSERTRAVDHTTYEKTRNPDAVLRDDDEEDTLYSDGLEVDDDAAPLGTPRR